MSRPPEEPLYEPLGWALLRAPLLSTNAYRDLVTSPAGLDSLVEDERVRAALGIASGSIAGALDRAPGSDKRARRLRAGLLRYAIRMSTRPTPYGLFAGVGLVPFSGRTDAQLLDGWRTRARPDMDLLLRFVMRVESRPEVRRRLRLFANPCAYEQSGRIHLIATEPASVRTEPVAVSLRATAPVRAVLSAARRPVPYARLLEEILGFPGATPARAHHLLDALWEQSVLLSDLRPPATATDPAAYVLDRLADVPEAQAEAGRLEELVRTMREWDASPLDAKAGRYPSVVKAAAALGEDSGRQDTAAGVQVDLALAVRGGLTAAILPEAVVAATALLRCTPWPSGPSRLQAYRQAFRDRYSDGDVPLLELLDERTGLGPVDRERGEPAEPSTAARDQFLRTMAVEAVRDGRTKLELDEGSLRRLRTWDGPAREAPYSLDLALIVLAASREALDAGDFELMVGPNVGASAAGCGAGRFADLLGPDAGAALADAARREAALRPDALWAEVSFLPARLRLTNVAVRPLARDAEITIGTPGVARDDRVIAPHDLLVGLRDGRFVLRWSRTGQEVVPCAGHMLNTRWAPAVGRFLDDLRHDLRPRLGPFDWGSSAALPFLPRVQHGRVILAPAQWRLDAEIPPQADQFAEAVTAWREAWHVPRLVYLSVADHRLLLDLGDAEQVRLLHAEARKEPDGPGIVLQEALPAPEHAWLPGPDGPRVAEIVVPLVRRCADPPGHRRPAARHTVTATDRIRPAGSDWLHIKLYGPHDQSTDLLVRHVLPFTEFAVSAGLAAAWFFVRYADPDPHLRLRFRGDPPTMLRRLLPEVVTWSNRLLEDGQVRRWRLDDYEREIERYGGPEATRVAEDIAAADSLAVAQLLALGPAPADPLVLAALGIDDLLAAMGLDVEQRRQWCTVPGTARRSSAGDHRRLRGALHDLTIDRSRLDALPHGAAALDILAARRAKFEHLAAEPALARGDKPIGTLLRSYVHLHCNRLLGAGPGETVAIDLLRRELDRIVRQP